MDYVEARSLGEALDALSAPAGSARVVAGGVALSIMMRWGFLKPERLVSIRYADELRAIRLDADGTLRIGAAVTHREVELSPVVRRHFPVLAEMETGLASVQVRNAATVGGNLCQADSASDPGPVLLALGASVLLASPRGKRTVPLDDFFRGPLTTVIAADELLVEILVPPGPPHSGAAYLKHSTRNAVDFPFAGVAARVSLEADGARCASVRVAMGALGPTPVVSAHVSEVLCGERLTDAALREAGRRVSGEVRPPDDGFGSAEYRAHLAGVLAQRALRQAFERAQAQ